MNIIAADVGGTNARFVFSDSENPGHILYEAHYASRDFDSFEPLLEQFIDDTGSSYGQAASLSLALPGIVTEATARLTNLPWTIEKQALQDRFGIEHIHFMNDFQASASGTRLLNDHDRIVLNPGVHKIGATRVAVGAGTGLGVAWMLGNDASTRTSATEGGHVDFAPVDEVQMDLLRFLMKRHTHVSYERILSGAGLVTLYEFCSGTAPRDIEPRWVSEQAEQGDEHAQQALKLFVQIYGAYIGNLSLLFKPGDGIFITGGIAAKIQQWMQSKDFLQAYSNKGRMSTLVSQFAVYLVTNERVGVLGALSEAMKIQQVKES